MSQDFAVTLIIYLDANDEEDAAEKGWRLAQMIEQRAGVLAGVPVDSSVALERINERFDVERFGAACLGEDTTWHRQRRLARHTLSQQPREASRAG
jgi:hypothetical protein